LFVFANLVRMREPTMKTKSTAESFTAKSSPSRSRRHDALPGTLAPRGLSRLAAAAYVGVSPSLFDEMVRDGRMPPPKMINSRLVWDRFELDAAFDELPDKAQAAADDDWTVAV
jgi:predicted DNA-binding transcriptional regulator AlpA